MIDLPPLRTREPVPTPVTLRLDEAARALSVSTRTVRRLVQRGDLAASRIGRMLLFEPRAIEALLARTRIGGPP